MTIPLISVTILTKNSQKYLKEVLSALKNFDEVVIYDTGSTDATLTIAHQFLNVTIVESSFIGFGPTHNLASNYARNDWILSIDSDEVVTKELFQAIEQLQLDLSCVYSFPRHNEYKGKWIKGCGWYPDHQTRLYNKKVTQFTDAQVHEAVIKKDLKEIVLDAPLRHYSYASVEDFLTKMQLYSSLFAHQYQGKKTASFSQAVAHGAFAFFKSYFLKKGFLLGTQGFEISWYNGNTAFYKYLKLAEVNARLKNQTQFVEANDDDQMKKGASQVL